MNVKKIILRLSLLALLANIAIPFASSRGSYQTDTYWFCVTIGTSTWDERFPYPGQDPEVWHYDGCYSINTKFHEIENGPGDQITIEYQWGTYSPPAWTLKSTDTSNPVQYVGDYSGTHLSNGDSMRVWVNRNNNEELTGYVKIISYYN